MKVRILSPDRLVSDITTNELLVPGSQGFMTILPGHAKLVCELGTGVLQVEPSSEGDKYFIAGGYLEVDSDDIAVIADVVEKREEIDVDRAKSSQGRAESRLSGSDGDVDLDRASKSLKRAEERIAFAT